MIPLLMVERSYLFDHELSTYVLFFIVVETGFWPRIVVLQMKRRLPMLYIMDRFARLSPRHCVMCNSCSERSVVSFLCVGDA